MMKTNYLAQVVPAKEDQLWLEIYFLSLSDSMFLFYAQRLSGKQDYWLCLAHDIF